jgi:DNA-binding HxlR family transcriptional regulator
LLLWKVSNEFHLQCKTNYFVKASKKLQLRTACYGGSVPAEPSGGAPATRSDRRSYRDACATARALDVIGERWALLIVRELLFGPKRFGDLQSGLATVRPNVLSQRLRELEGSRVIRRRRLGRPASVWVYELTEWGRQLEGVLLMLGEWGQAVPLDAEDARISVDALMLALKTHFDATKAATLAATLLVAIDDDHFTVAFGDGGLTISRDEPPNFDAALFSDPATFKALIIDGEPRQQAEADGRLRISGDARIVDELLGALRG